ncbi:MAG TPA: non-homologous end-joining DNA ligase [Candidatus Eremiobacteraceae bacterium]|nr:non-homologous end-joining DNA ligase [Candidatus Eremiobacteraceae bacterium]
MPRSASSAKTVVFRAGAKSVTISNYDKVLWPADGYTKGDLVEYYRAVAKWLLPYIEGRPLSLERFPNGVNKPGFFEKNAPAGIPDWVETVTLESDGKRSHIRYVVCEDVPTLVYLANLAAITLHAFMSRRGSLDEPDFILFDLDRGDGCPVKSLATVAVVIADELRKRRMRALPKTSGGSGLHLFAWVRGRWSYEKARAFCNEVALAAQARLPKLVTLERSIAKRPRGRVYVDWAQMGKGRTVVMPFAVRARRGAPVSMPLPWSAVRAMLRSDELDTARYFARWNVGNVPGILRRSGDAWKRRT